MRALAVAAACAGSAAAQDSRRVEKSPADAAIAEGRLKDAEAYLFEAVRIAPREPSSRGALGTFLAARGNYLVGATLLDETLQFGGDTAAVEARRYVVYRWAGDYARAAAQRTVKVGESEREAMRRAGVAEPAGALTATVPLQPNEALGLGRITISIGNVKFDADIQPFAEGLLLPATMEALAAVEQVGAQHDTAYGVARRVSIGGATVGAVPVALVRSITVARIGLDVLAHLRPTFDAAAHTLTLHTNPKFQPTGAPIATLLTFPGIGIAAREGAPLAQLHTAAGRAAVREGRWTLDLENGSIFIER